MTSTGNHVNGGRGEDAKPLGTTKAAFEVARI